LIDNCIGWSAYAGGRWSDDPFYPSTDLNLTERQKPSKTEQEPGKKPGKILNHYFKERALNFKRRKYYVKFVKIIIG